MSAVLLLLAALPAYSRMAVLDESFGHGGTTVLPVGPHCYSVAAEPDGALVLAGGSAFYPPFGENEYDATLVRLLPDGRPDPGFGENGVVVRRTGERSFEDVFFAVRITSDGRIVAVGHEIQGETSRGLVARFEPDGDPDAGFGDGGRVTFSLGDTTSASRVVVRSDGRIVVLATVWLPGALPGGFPGVDFHTDLALVRFQSDGTIDESFGESGMRRVDDDALEYGLGLIEQAGGALVLAAALDEGITLDYDVALSRYDANGSRDPTFGDGGRNRLHLGYSDIRATVQPLSGERLLVTSGGPGIVLARLDRNGHLDPGFGTRGIAHAGEALWVTRAAAVVGHDEILVGLLDAGRDPYTARLVRFARDGHPRGGDVELPSDLGHLLARADGRLVTVTFDAGASWVATGLEPPWGRRRGWPTR